MNKRDFWRESTGEAGRLSVLFASAVMNEMDKQKVSRKELAKRMGVSRQVVYSHLDGEKPITMLTMGKFAAGLGIYFELKIMKGVKRYGPSSRSRPPRGSVQQRPRPK